MTLTMPSEIRNVQGLLDDELQLVRSFVQGAVYCWVKNRKGEWFAVRDLVGGENTDWTGTPLESIYARHIGIGKADNEAFESAAKDIGWIVKSVLADDRRCFENDHSGYVARYRWLEGQN